MFLSGKSEILVDPIAIWLGQWVQDVTIGSIIIRVVLCVILGAIVGIDRANKRQAAGLRTYILVSLGETVAMMTNQFIRETYNDQNVARLGAQVISGIGFLGAGTIIITARNRVKGLTTAAGLWAVACVSLAIGIGFYTLAIISFIVIILSLKFFPVLEARLTRGGKVATIHIELNQRTDLKDLIVVLREVYLVNIKSLDRNRAYTDSGISAYTMALENKEEKIKTELLIEALLDLPYVSFAEEIV